MADLDASFGEQVNFCWGQLDAMGGEGVRFEQAEMVEMLEASRQYQNMVEALSTAKQLMLETMRMK